MRFFYSLAWWLALPLVLMRLWWRGRREPGYRAHWGERLGLYGGASIPRPSIWVHAVSVGETRAAEPLIQALLARYPEHCIVLTHMTPTGRATGRSLFGASDRVRQSYLPYDVPALVGRFIRHFKPQLCVLMETEIWPNLIAQCGRQGVPIALVNARLSARSLAKAQRFSRLFADAAAGLSMVLAQTDADAARLRQAGAARVEVTGSLKFDVVPPDAMLERGRALRRCFGARPVLLCASTREGEESLLLDALAAFALPPGLQDLLIVIVPRHPQRFDEVAGLVTARGWRLQRRSALDLEPGNEGSLPPDIGFVLGDSMGELFAYYAASDVAFIGGSLLPLGGQNLIEACAVGTPVLIGPHTFNFETITQDAIAAGAALCIDDAAALFHRAACLLDDSAARGTMSEAALSFAALHRGATARSVQSLSTLLAPSAGQPLSKC